MKPLDGGRELKSGWMGIVPGAPTLKKEHSSADNLMSRKGVEVLRKKSALIVGDRIEEEEEMLE